MLFPSSIMNNKINPERKRSQIKATHMQPGTLLPQDLTFPDCEGWLLSRAGEARGRTLFSLRVSLSGTPALPI